MGAGRGRMLRPALRRRMLRPALLLPGKVHGPCIIVDMAEAPPDGRAQRRVATMVKLVDAHTRLLRAGELAPTSVQVAEEAGVSLRTLWAAFGDMEALLEATTAYWTEASMALRSRIDPALPFDDRVARFAADCEHFNEFLAPAGRAAVVRLPYSPTLQANRKEQIANLRRAVDETFAAELATRGEGVRDQVLAAASWPTWLLYRDDLGYSASGAREQLEHVLRALLS